MSHATYLNEIFSPDEFSEAVNLVSDIILEKFPDVDYIVGSGISGAVIIGAVANNTGKRIFIIRKENDNSHSFCASNSPLRDPDYLKDKEKFCEFEEISKISKSAVIIDDLISSGDTIRRITKKLWANDIIPAGIILYHETGDDYNFHDLDLEIEISVIQTKKDMD